MAGGAQPRNAGQQKKPKSPPKNLQNNFTQGKKKGMERNATELSSGGVKEPETGKVPKKKILNFWQITVQLFKSSDGTQIQKGLEKGRKHNHRRDRKTSFGSKLQTRDPKK